MLIRNFINQYFGIYFEDDKKWLLESKLNRLIQNHPVESFFEYYNVLIRRFMANPVANNPDIIELIRVISNNETYFCREHESFDLYRTRVIPEIHSRQSTIRVLSAGCSIGAEAYGLLFELLESGRGFFNTTPPVLGIDVDPFALEIAIGGAYNQKVVRTMQECPHMNFDKYFERIEDHHFVVRKKFRHLIDFKQVNLIDRHQLEFLGPFDVIFCRNVLIYFDDRSREIVLDIFFDIMDSGGYLFLSHSESLLGRQSKFEPIDGDHHIYYQKPEKYDRH